MNNEQQQNITDQENDFSQYDKGIILTCPPGGGHKERGVPPLVGFEGVLRSLEAVNTKLPIFFMIYPNKEHDRVLPTFIRMENIFKGKLIFTCYEMRKEVEIDYNYGMPKIRAILNAPVNEVLWLDCDTWVNYNLDNMFDEPLYQEFGSLFWPDINDNFRADIFYDRYRNRIDNTLFPFAGYNVQHPFDSGLLLLDKERCANAIEQLKKMRMDEFESMSFGDKDLWHMAWILSNTKFGFVPFNGMIVSIDIIEEDP
eukprot:UN24041